MADLHGVCRISKRSAHSRHLPESLAAIATPSAAIRSVMSPVASRHSEISSGVVPAEASSSDTAALREPPRNTKLRHDVGSCAGDGPAARAARLVTGTATPDPDITLAATGSSANARFGSGPLTSLAALDVSDTMPTRGTDAAFAPCSAVRLRPRGCSFSFRRCAETYHIGASPGRASPGGKGLAERRASARLSARRGRGLGRAAIAKPSRRDVRRPRIPRGLASRISF